MWFIGSGTLSTENADARNSRTLTDLNGRTRYHYDSLGNLRTVTLPNGDLIRYHIDPLNRRIAKDRNGVRQYGLLWLDSLRPLAEVDASGQLRSVFLYAEHANVPSAMERDGRLYRFLHDHLGSVRLVIDTHTGTVAQQLDYDVWGKVIQDTAPGFQPFGFAGGLYDPDTGLTRFGARDYDAETGRWTAKDPILFNGGDTNLYGYVMQDPVNGVDLEGLEWVVDTAKPPRSPQMTGGSTIYCKGEVPDIYIHPLSGSHRCPEVSEASVVHEKSHLQDVIMEKPDVCKGNSNDVIIVNTSNEERLASEERAHLATIEYLKSSLNTCRQDCRTSINSSINGNDFILNRKVRTGNYP